LENSTEITLGSIKHDVGLYCQGSHENSLEFRAGVVLYAAALVGTNPKDIAEFTGYSLKRGIVQGILKRIEDQKLIVAGRLNVLWEKESDSDEVSHTRVVMDIMCAAGQLVREYKEDENEFIYMLTPTSTRRVEVLDMWKPMDNAITHIAMDPPGYTPQE